MFLKLYYLFINFSFRPMLSKAAGHGSLENRVKQKIFSIQRSSDHMDKHFARRWGLTMKTYKLIYCIKWLYFTTEFLKSIGTLSIWTQEWKSLKIKSTLLWLFITGVCFSLSLHSRMSFRNQWWVLAWGKKKKNIHKQLF